MAAETTRPSKDSPTMISPALARGITGQPSPMPFRSPNGIKMAFASEKPTTSAVISWPVAVRTSQDVPTATCGSTASSTIPVTRVTLPAITQDSASARTRFIAVRFTRLTKDPRTNPC